MPWCLEISIAPDGVGVFRQPQSVEGVKIPGQQNEEATATNCEVVGTAPPARKRGSTAR